MGHKKVHQDSFKFSFITNQAFYIGGKITVKLDARRVGTILNCCNYRCGALRLHLFLVLIVWISQLCSNMSLLLITNNNEEHTFCDCSGNICNFLHCSLQESLLLMFVIILINLFCSLNILLLIEEFPQNIIS